MLSRKKLVFYKTGCKIILRGCRSESGEAS